ncbi:phage integrase N-terminal SAM-like domain-containing protein [Pleurocapsales cyanobacterium LEGE 10410]|nr:phage integrase N-terminal SAM-like domain-containing protein [Pleurocapsales cyanobacterium LEGE 10410]
MLEFTPVSQPEVLPESPIELVEPKGKGLDEAFEEFLGFEVADGAASVDTINNYKSQTKMFLQWCIDTEVNPLLADKRHIQLYRKHLIEKYQPATIQLKLQVVRRFYDALIDSQLVKFNPAVNVKAPINKRSNVKIQYLELEQLTLLLKLAAGNSPKQKRDRVIVGLMALQGLRTIEVQRLSFGDFSRQGKKNFITVSAKRSQRRDKTKQSRFASYLWYSSLRQE